MCVPAQTDKAGWRELCNRRFATSYGHDLGRMSMKHTLLREINQDLAVRPAPRNLHAPAVAHDPTRIQGGNWQTQGFRRSGYHDEAECEMSITEFMADARERNDIVD
jgi:hypothetical protein